MGATTRSPYIDIPVEAGTPPVVTERGNYGSGHGNRQAEELGEGYAVAMRAWVMLAAITPLGCGGRGDILGCASYGHGGAYDECVASGKGPGESKEQKRARPERERMAAEKLAEQKRKERAEYDAAVAPCKRGEATPCLIVARYGLVNKHDVVTVRAAFEVACDGKIADACFARGQLGGGLAFYERACAADSLKGCLEAAALDKPRAMTFEARACELRDFTACERVGLAYASTDNRAEAEKYLKLACGADRKAACRRLGELVVGQ